MCICASLRAKQRRDIKRKRRALRNQAIEYLTSHTERFSPFYRRRRRPCLLRLPPVAFFELACICIFVVGTQCSSKTICIASSSRVAGFPCPYLSKGRLHSAAYLSHSRRSAPLLYLLLFFYCRIFRTTMAFLSMRRASSLGNSPCLFSQ